MDYLKQKAIDFLALHHASEILILPNAWDVASQKIFELEGFKAIGTTSAGVAAALGYADGQKMSLDQNLEVVKRMANITSLPVSADIEAGYSTSVDAMATVAEKVLTAGAVGLNIEDGSGDEGSPLFDIKAQQNKIRAMRERSAALGLRLVINARTDVYLASDDLGQNLDQAIKRGNAYHEAGADCIFVPDMGNLNKQAIAALVDGIEAPVNILAGDSTPPIGELQDMGVARVSLGPRPMRAVLSLLRRIAQEIKTDGTYQLMNKSTISYGEVNGWFDRK